MSEKRGIFRLVIMALVVGGLLLFGGTLFTVSAAENDPVNLSRSGAAGAPIALPEADGTLHVIWQDRFIGFVYSRGQGTNWTEPTAVTLPFSEPPFSSPTSDNFRGLLTPKLLLDGQGLVHAFWQLDEALFYSSAPLAELASSAAWSAPQSLAASAPAYAVNVAADGRLHLAYIRTANTDDFPTGVYYRRQATDGWSSATQLYQSSYLRAANGDQLHIDLTTVGSERIVIGWDNYLADAIFYVRSSDGGGNWPEPIALDQRGEEDGLDTPGPHYLQLFTHDNNVHLLWNRYSNVGRCELIHRWVADGGSDWQPRQVLFDGVACPAPRQPLVDESTGRLHLFTEQEQGGTVIRSWLGTEWSIPQVRSGLFSFSNAETFRSVSLGCLRPLAAQNQLLVVGCAQGNIEDVWLVKGNLPDIAQFVVESTRRWQLPERVARLSNWQYDPIVLQGGDGLVHALWLEQETDLLIDSVPVVRYAYWDGTGWSRPAPIVEGEIDQITAAIGSNNRLMLAWRDLQQGSLWFSQVDAAQAAFPAQWSPPKELVSYIPAVSRPSLLATAAENIYLAYALTVNEGRGIYLMHSDDNGRNWSQPLLAFDAVEANWSMVDAPDLAQTVDGGLHLLWSRHDLLSGNRPLAYYYARSLDNGRNWSANPTLVAEGGVTRGQVVANPFGNELLRIWQDESQELGVLWYQHSENAGRTWTPSALLPSLGDLSENFTTFVDPAGRIHLLHMAVNEAGLAQLDNWLWESAGWQAGDETTFEFAPSGNGRSLAAAISEDGAFLVLFAGIPASEAVQDTESRLFYTTRPIDLPTEQLVATPIEEELTPEAAPENDDSQVDDEEQPLASPVDLAALESETAVRTQFGPLDLSTSTGRILAGVLPAMLIVLFGVAVGVYALRKRE